MPNPSQVCDDDDQFANTQAEIAELVDEARAALLQTNQTGVCQNCGVQIESGRSEAMPGVAYCLDCQTQLEEK